MGKPQFESQVQIAAVSSKKIVVVHVEKTTAIAAGTSEVNTVYSPENTVSKVLAARLVWENVAGATSGTKTINTGMELGSAYGTMGMSRIDGAYNSYLKYDQGEITGQSQFYPNDLAGYTAQIQNTTFDENRGMTVTFINNTNASSAAVRKYTLVVEQEVINR